MTDYLEEALEQTQALLEQVQKLERKLFGRTREPEGEAQGDASPFQQGSETDAAPEEPSGEAEDRAKWKGQAVNQEELSVDKAKREVDKRRENVRSRPAPPLEDGELEPPERVKTPLEEQTDRAEGAAGRIGEPAGGTAGRAGAPDLEPAGRGEALTEKPAPGQKRNTNPALSSRLEGADGQAPEASTWERPRSALLSQMVRLERAAAVSVSDAARPGRGGGDFAPFTGTAAVLPDVTGETGGGWAGGWGRPEPLSDRGLRWAEQADRAFRRDSRRYDGNFYLY